MGALLFSRLSLMMFLEFFLWGAWWVTLSMYMGANERLEPYIGWAYLSQPIGAMISPFFLGMVADRFFSAERVLGLETEGALVSEVSTPGRYASLQDFE